jgi:uncharacterized membrane protein YtjA (UPF0391 family)
MAYWAAGFMLMAVTAAGLRLSGLAALSPLDAWALFLVGVILALMSMLLNSRTPAPYRQDKQDKNGGRGHPAP